MMSNMTITPGAEIATIRWNTDEPALTRVDYGLTNSYGDFVQDLTTFATNHVFTLTGLTPGVEYHCMLTSTDSSLNIGSSLTRWSAFTAAPSNIRTK